MYRSFFTGLFFLILYKKTYAFTPVDCLQNLSKSTELETQFTGTGNVYCAYLNSNSIQEVTFNIKNTDINDWDITVGNWDTQNAFVDTKNPLVITDTSANNYKISMQNDNVNAIVWVLNNGNNGIIENVNLLKNLSKRDENSCGAFDPNFIWEDISWDSTNEKSFSDRSGVINLNNTVYLNTLALLFKKKNSNGSNDYFTNDFSIDFKIKSDSPNWVVYTGEYDKSTSEVLICKEWELWNIYSDISVTKETVVSLEEEESSCKNNIIWFQNAKNDQSSQRIWISNMVVKNCNNDDDD